MAKAEEEKEVSLYKVFVRPLLFLFDAERIHHAVFGVLSLTQHLPGFQYLLRTIYAIRHPRLKRQVLGLTFENPVGLAAGFDKDARLIDTMAAFGFGFVEVGTLTPKPQPGNDKPRLFRLPADRALINRMGFNNEGVLAAVHRLKARKSSVLVGGNIGKNKVTPNDKAVDDYNYCFEALYPYVDYFVVNVSSPNTPGLRELQEKEPLTKLLEQVKALSEAKPKPKPIVLKIAPDLNNSQLDDIIEILKTTRTDGVIATNTTISREGLATSAGQVASIGTGGLSGAPLAERSTEVIRYLSQRLGPDYPIIGVGGIMSVEDALAKIKAGADLIQIYTGFIYEGPRFVKRLNRSLLKI